MNSKYYNIPVTYENEGQEETLKFIESKRSCDIANQRYRITPEKEEIIERKTNISECNIYWRGEYLIIEHEGIIHYWDSFPYCFLKQAIEFMEPEKPAKWKTLGRLIDFRMGIRQTEVNLCGYVETIIEGEEMSFPLYNKFMRFARSQDLQHHGDHTF